MRVFLGILICFSVSNIGGSTGVLWPMLLCAPLRFSSVCAFLTQDGGVYQSWYVPVCSCCQSFLSASWRFFVEAFFF